MNWLYVNVIILNLQLVSLEYYELIICDCYYSQSPFLERGGGGGGGGWRSGEGVVIQWVWKLSRTTSGEYITVYMCMRIVFAMKSLADPSPRWRTSVASEGNSKRKRMQVSRKWTRGLVGRTYWARQKWLSIQLPTKRTRWFDERRRDRARALWRNVDLGASECPVLRWTRCKLQVILHTGFSKIAPQATLVPASPSISFTCVLLDFIC